MYEKHVGITTRVTAIIVIIILVVVGAGVGLYYYSQPTTTTAPPSQRGKIVVGFTFSKTGTYNVEGTNSLNGIIAAAKWINDNGGVTVNGKVYNITLDYYDDASQSSQIVPLYTKIIQTDHAQFLLAPYSSGLTAAAAPLADQYSLVMLSHGGASDPIWQKGYKNVFGVLSPASYYLRSGIDWLKANHPGDKLAFIYANDAFSSYAAQSAINYSKSQGFNVVYSASYPTTVTDVTPQLTAAKAAGADDLLGGGHFQDGLLLMKQTQSVGWTPKFISLLVAVTEPSFQQQLGATANIVTGPSQWETLVKYSPSAAQSAGIPWFGPTNAQFTQYYHAIPGSVGPTYHSGEAGAAIIVLADAIQSANSLDTAAVRAQLQQMHIMTFFGQYQVDSTGKQMAHSMVLDQWHNGNLTVVAPADAATGSVVYPYTGS